MRNQPPSRVERLLLAAGKKVKERDYWLKKLAGELVRSGFPPFHEQAGGGEKSLEQLSLRFDEGLSSGLMKLSTGSDIRLFILLTAVLTLLLGKYTGHDDIIVGIPILKSEKNDAEDGLINTALVLRNQLHSEMTFKELLLRVRETISEADEHRNYPLEILMHQLGLPDPPVDVAVLLEEIHDKRYVSSLKPKTIFSFSRKGSHIEGLVEYSTLSDRSLTMERIIGHFQHLARLVLDNLEIKLADIEILLPEEKQQLLNEFNDTSAPFPAEKTLHELFEEQVERTPHAAALVGMGIGQRGMEYAGYQPAVPPGWISLTYMELNHQSDQLARCLTGKGVKPNTIAAVMLEHSVNLIIGILGILKSGGAYLPLDPNHPQERIQYTLSDSGAKILLTSRDLADKFQEGDRFKTCSHIELIDKCGVERRTLSHLHLPPPPTTGLAYIIYTSGTSGRPKGVEVEHRAVVNMLVCRKQAYNMGAADTSLQLFSCSFDGFITSLFTPIISGARVILLSGRKQKDIARIKEIIVKHRVSHFITVPALYAAIIDALMPAETVALKLVTLAGDKIGLNLLASTRGKNNALEIANEYGVTEVSVMSTLYRHQERDRTIKIGFPIWNTRIYILDRYLRVQPIGVAGELCIAGAGLARGYLNQPDLTAERFITTPDSSGPNIPSFHHSIIPVAQRSEARFYRSGDLARWLPDGSIEFMGRIDSQVKIRGFRIELAEIESRLLAHKDIQEVLVMDRENQNGEKHLCAYIAAKARGVEVEPAELREFLSRSLPDYMVPAHFVWLKALPLTPAGKVDIRALPVPDFERNGVPYVSPRNELEKVLVGIWTHVLGLDGGGTLPAAVGIDDNFFQLGGHSLKATRLVYQVYKEFGVNIEIEDVFTHPTIRQLAQRMENLEELAYLEITSVEQKQYYELSYAQRRLWVLCQFEQDSTAYNIPSALIVSGQLDAAAFSRAFQTLVDRHDSLRTVFAAVDGKPVQKVIKDFEFRLKEEDLRGLDERTRAEKVREIYLLAAGRAFNLEKGPLFLVNLLRLEDEEYLFIFNIHHIINDGWSVGNINNELLALYNAYIKNEANPLPPVRWQYKDYSSWHNALIESGRFDRSGEYWLNKFKDRPTGIELPLDYPRQPIQTFNGARVAFSLEANKTGQLKRMGSEEDATLFMIMLTVLDIFLYRYSGQQDIIIGAPMAGRRRHELDEMIGFLVNTLVYRSELNPRQSFKELLPRVKQEALAAYENQDYPFDLLIDKLELTRDLSQSPLFNVFLAHNNAGTRDRSLRLAGLSIHPYAHAHEFNMSKFDLTFFQDEIGDELSIHIEYNSDLFRRSTIEQMAANFQVLVNEVIQERDVPIFTLHYLDPAEYNRVVREFNDTYEPFSDLSLQEFFEKQVEETPDRVALVGLPQEARAQGVVLPTDKLPCVTYRELNQRVNQLAHYLREEYQVKPNDVIGIALGRSIDMVIALLGTIKSGAAYLAVDPSYPLNRILYMLEDSHTQLVIGDEARLRSFHDFTGQLIDMKRNRDKIARKPVENPFMVNKPQDILYATYTSGSTGKPNGALVSHRTLTNLIRWQREKTTITGSLRCLQFASINFDVSFQEITATLTAGGELHLIGEMERKDIDYLLDFLIRYRIEILYLPFYYLNFLFTESRRWFAGFHHSLKHLVTAGEQLILTPGLKFFLESNAGVQLHNHYGPAEMHVVTSYTLAGIPAGEKSLPPIGKPIANVRIYILDEYHQPVPTGIWGEIHIIGPAGFAGYLNKVELTVKKSLLQPGLCFNGHGLYRTGDIGRWLWDGNIELKGRKDSMVKFRGFRIELGEIESKLLAIEGVRECVVEVKEDEKGQKFLAAYVVPTDLNEVEIKRRLARDLPQHMIPGIVKLASLPLLPNGKVDRDRLPQPGIELAEVYAPPHDDVERKMVEIWSELLGLDSSRIGVETSFFELGGHSLKATLMVSRIHREFQVKVALAEIFTTPHIRGLAGIIRGKVTDRFTPLEPVEEKLYYPLSPAQRRLYILQQFDRANLAYNMPAVMELDGALDMERLTAAFRGLIARHQSLRTSFHARAQEPVQVIHRLDEIRFEIDDPALMPDACCLGPDQIICHFIRPFDLSRAPLLRVGLVHRAGEKCLLVLDMHHIICDGVSMNLFTREFMALYAGEELPPIRVHYRDYAEWRNSDTEKARIKRQETYWLNQFAGLVPVLDLPYDHGRAPLPDFAGKTLTFEIVKEEATALNRLALGQGATLFMVLLAGYSLLLSKLSGQEEVVVGTPVAGRRHTDLESVIGMFINTLCLRTYPGGEKTFLEFLGEVREGTLSAFENQEYQFEDLVEKVSVERDTSRNPLFDVMFALQNMGVANIDIPGLKLGPYEFDSQTAKFDLNLHVYEVEAGLFFTWQFRTKLFEEETIKRFIEYLKRILAMITKEPGIRLSGIDILSAQERKQLLGDFNHTRVDYPAEQTLHQLFADQVGKSPDHLAVGGPENLTYRELNTKANHLAWFLREKGTAPHSIVGLLVRRSSAAVSAIFAVLRAGAAFLPIDPDYPQERIRYMLSDSGAEILLTSRDLADKFQDRDRFKTCPHIELIDEWEGEQRILSHLHLAPPPGTGHRLPATALAYIIYTSGSTGQPKGAMQTHANAINYIWWAKKQYVQGERVNFPLFTSLSFDLTITSIFVPLLSGHTLVVYRDTRQEFLISEIITADQLGMVKLTPGHLKLIVNMRCNGDSSCQDKIDSSIRGFIVGGEALDTGLANRVAERFKNPIVIYNEYGPTETTVGCMIHRYNPQKDKRHSVPIGIPADNVRIYLLSRDQKPVPLGAAGEICVSGQGLGRGYLNRVELTAHRFLDNPFVPGEKMYRTGDLARLLPNGIVEFLGRIDQQVKIRGFRIELGEIESQLKAYRKGKPISITRYDDRIEKIGKARCCSRCVLPIDYPGIGFDVEGVCSVCRGYEKHKKEVDRYFKEREDFVALLEGVRQRNRGDYDCLLLFSGGKDSSFVLYQLIDMGLRVLTFTFDNGYISDAAFANIERITSSLGVENIVCRSEHMNQVFVESLHSSRNVCQGCWNALNTLGARTAHERGINLVISGLSRGQIVEMRLEGLFGQGIFSEQEIEGNLLLFRQTFHSRKNKFVRILDAELPEEAVAQIHFMDFFRYFNISVPEIRDYLTGKGWLQPGDTGFCSSNCIINDVGIYVFQKEKGYHFYASPLSWDCRLGVISRDQAMRELSFAGDLKQVDRILGEIGYYDSPVNDAVVLVNENSSGEKDLCAYIVSGEALTASELQEYLSKHLPDYMIPSHFVQVEKIPLTANGKLDGKALQRLGKRLDPGRAYAAPANETEEEVASIWSEVLGLGEVSTDANFFELGGNSLSLMQVNARMNESFGRDIPIATMFRLSTIQALARYIQEEAINLQVTDEILDRSVSTLDETLNLLGES